MPTCRRDEGGQPLCKLGLTARRVEIRGNCWSNVALTHKFRGFEPDAMPVLGPDQYDVVVVCDTPGPSEEESGTPASGNRSKKLFEFLEKSGLNLDRVFITNFIRCVPPNGRKPSAGEIKTCRQHLQKELELIQPKVVMLLGATALRAFNIKEGTITTLRGTILKRKFPNWEESPEFTIVPSVSPATFMYKENTPLELRVRTDYHLAAGIVNNVPAHAPNTPKYKVIKTLDALRELVSELNSVPYFAFDTEGPNLRWWENPIMCVGFTWGFPGKTAVVPLNLHDPSVVRTSPTTAPWSLMSAWTEAELPEVLKLLREPFLNPKVAKIAHNLKFDYLNIRHALDIKIAGFLWDTIIMHHLLDESPPHDLESLAEIEFGYGDYSAMVRKIVGKGKKLKASYDNIPDDILHPYNATDCESTYRLFLIFTERMKRKPHLMQLYKSECEGMIRELAKSEWFGVPVDMVKVGYLITEYEMEQEQVLLDLRAKTFPDFNPGSPAQVAKACQMLGFGNEILDPTSASGICTDKGVLTSLAAKDSFFPNILRYRNLDKLVNTYLRNIESDLGADGSLRISWRQAGPETGRLSAPLLHQVPKTDKNRVKAGKVIMRDVFYAPDGYSFIYVDYSQVELRILAIESQDTEMLRLFANNGDIHLATTAEILGIPEKGIGLVRTPDGSFEAEAEPNRDVIGKGVNFGLAYGSQGHALAGNVQWVDIHGVKHNLTWDLLNVGMLRWKERFRGIADYTSTIPILARNNNGVIVNRFGRERRFGSRLSDFKEGRKAAREAINFPIQSTATNITNGTIVRVGQEIDKLVEQGTLKEEYIAMLLTVHDSIGYRCKNYLVPWFTDVLKGIGERQVPELDNYSFPMSIGIGRSWYAAEQHSKGITV